MELVDRGLRGLMLIKRKNGPTKWFLKYQCPRTLQKRSVSFGLYPDVPLDIARQQAMQLIRQEYGDDQFELMNSPAHSFHDFTAQENVGGGEFNSQVLPIQESEPIKTNPVLNHLPTIAKPQPGNSLFITLNQFVINFYLPYIKVAKRSWATDFSVLNNHILPKLGGYAMIDIRPFAVQEMVQSLVQKNLSPSTCNRALIIVRFMFNCALRWEVLKKIDNPCKHIKELPLNNKKERFLNTNEIYALKLELVKSKNRFLPYIVQLLILTGCRRGEALKAQIQHFDLGRGDWIVPLPKSGKARHIPLNLHAVQTIRASITMKQSYNQITRESIYLFPNPTSGEPFQQIFYSWDKARRAAQIETVRMHDLRHSFASALVNSGMTLYDVKEILGHSNIRTTERYAHLSNSRLRQAAESVTTFYGDQNWIGDDQALATKKDASKYLSKNASNMSKEELPTDD